MCVHWPSGRFKTATGYPCDEGDDVTSPTHVDKAAIVAVLRAGGRQTGADRFDRELPGFVDRGNAALPQRLRPYTAAGEL